MDSEHDQRLSPRVEFEDQGEQPQKFYHQKQTSKIVELTMKYSGGIIKDERQASYIILTASILITLTSLFFLLKGESVPNIPPPANYPSLHKK